MNDQTRRILMGRIHGAFGVRGELKLESFSDPPEAILRYRPLLLRTAQGGERELEDVRAELAEARKAGRAAQTESRRLQADVEPDIVVLDGNNVIVMEVKGLGGDALLDLSDRFKQRSSPAAVVLGSR